MTPRSILASLAIAGGALGLLAVMPGSDLPASAQTAPVTAPCDDPQCGPNDPAPGSQTKAFAYGNFYCDPVKGISVTVGVGKDAKPTTFAVTITGGLDKELMIGPVQPGKSVTTATFAVPSGHVQVTVLSNGTPFNHPMPDPKNLTARSFPITCDCPSQPTTSTPSSVATTPPVTTAPASTVPGTPTTVPATVPGSPGTTQPFTLPDTGATTWPLVAAGAVVLLAGAGSLLVVRKREDER